MGVLDLGGDVKGKGHFWGWMWGIPL